MGFNFEEELKKLPKKPGVYIMRDDKDVILYVGKAINLHKVGSLCTREKDMRLILTELTQCFRFSHAPPAIQHNKLASLLCIFIL